MSLKSLFRKAYSKARQESFVYGRIGKHNPSPIPITYEVTGRLDQLWVTLEDKTVVTARNEAGVPQTEDLAVKLRVEHNQHVIVGRSTRGELSAPTETPPSGVLAHPISEHSDATITAAANGDVLAHNGTAWVDETPVVTSAGAADAGKLVRLDAGGHVDATMVNDADIAAKFDGAAAISDPTGTNFGVTLAGVLKSFSWPAFKTFLDGLYVVLAGSVAQTITGIKTFSTRIDAPIIRANSAAGLRGEDDGGNLGWFVQDVYGYVGVNTNTPEIITPSYSYATAVASLLQIGGRQYARLAVRGSVNAGVEFVDTGAGANLKWMGLVCENGTTRYLSVNDNGTVNVDNIMVMDHATGKVGIGVTTIGASVLGIKAGTSSNDAAVGGVLYVTTTAVGNVGTGEDDLASYSAPANTLAVNNQSLWFEAWGAVVGNSNAKFVRVRFGTSGTNLFAAITIPINTSGSWYIKCRIVRTGAATQMASGFTIDNTGAFAPLVATALDQTLSGAVTLKVTGEAVSNNDVTIQGFIVGYDDANT